MDSDEPNKGITVKITRNFRDIDVTVPLLRQLVRSVCKRFEVGRATVGVAIVDDAEIRKLNKEFLKHDWPTDCLSFDLSEAESTVKCFEIVVNGQRAIKEAKLRGHLPQAELALYLTHALLHNLGFDDTTDDQAEKMHRTEDEILSRQGFGFVYNTNGDTEGGTP